MPAAHYTMELPSDAEFAPTREACRRWIAGLIDAVGDGDLWVFAYGSLIWNTDFPVVERRLAHLYGYHRDFCVYSYHYRGTPDDPGLVLGLDRGGSCRGVAFRVARRHLEPVARYLWRREIVAHAYRPRAVAVETDRGRVTAQTFVADPAHDQYAGGLTRDEKLRILRRASGYRGSNRAYLAATVDRLAQLGIHDTSLLRLRRVVG